MAIRLADVLMQSLQFFKLPGVAIHAFTCIQCADSACCTDSLVSLTFWKTLVARKAASCTSPWLQEETPVGT